MVVIRFGTLNIVKICSTFTAIHLKLSNYHGNSYVSSLYR